MSMFRVTVEIHGLETREFRLGASDLEALMTMLPSGEVEEATCHAGVTGNGATPTRTVEQRATGTRKGDPAAVPVVVVREREREKLLEQEPDRRCRTVKNPPLDQEMVERVVRLLVAGADVAATAETTGADLSQVRHIANGTTYLRWTGFTPFKDRERTDRMNPKDYNRNPDGSLTKKARGIMERFREAHEKAMKNRYGYRP